MTTQQTILLVTSPQTGNSLLVTANQKTATAKPIPTRLWLWTPRMVWPRRCRVESDWAGKTFECNTRGLGHLQIFCRLIGWVHFILRSGGVFLQVLFFNCLDWKVSGTRIIFGVLGSKSPLWLRRVLQPCNSISNGFVQIKIFLTSTDNFYLTQMSVGRGELPVCPTDPYYPLGTVFVGVACHFFDTCTYNLTLVKRDPTNFPPYGTKGSKCAEAISKGEIPDRHTCT